jgi:hypothetical protein
LLQGLSSEADGILLNGHFLDGILQVKESIANLLVNDGMQVFQSLLGACQDGICNKAISVNPASLEKGNRSCAAASTVPRFDAKFVPMDP